MELTNQDRGELVYKKKQTFKTRVNKKTSIARIVSQSLINQYSINHPLHKNLVKVLSFKKIFSLTFSKLTKNKIRKKDKIKRRSTPIFILVHCLKNNYAIVYDKFVVDYTETLVCKLKKLV